MIEGIPISGLTAPAIVSIAILMLFTGKLWTNVAYQQKCKEADQWRMAYEAEREARKMSDDQTKELLELAKTTNSFMTAVFYNSEQIRQSKRGASDVASSKTS